MIPKPAQYLLRFDDLCPTMPRERWEQFRNLIDEFGVRPILAVVPDNQDSRLERAPADPDSGPNCGPWRRPALPSRFMATGTLQQPGKEPAWNSSKNGICRSRPRDAARMDPGGLQDSARSWTESAPLGRASPRLRPEYSPRLARIWAGVHLRRFCADPVSPRCHDVDSAAAMGAGGEKKGLWTICIHPYAASSNDIERLQSFLQNHASQITSFDRVLKEFPPSSLGVWERMYQALALRRVQRRNRRRRKRTHRQ